MADEEAGRRDRLAILAFDPETGADAVVYLSHHRILQMGKRSTGQIKEAAELVPYALQRGAAVFEGFLDETDEPERGQG